MAYIRFQTVEGKRQTKDGRQLKKGHHKFWKFVPKKRSFKNFFPPQTWRQVSAYRWLQQVAAAVIKLVWCFRAWNQDNNGRSGKQSSCNYSGNQNPSCFQRTVETVLNR